MWKKVMLAGLISATPFAGATAQTVIVWQGAATVTGVSNPDACLPHYKLGDFLPGVFRPRLSPGEPSSALTFILAREAHIYFRDDPTPPGDQWHGFRKYSATLTSARAAIPTPFSAMFSFGQMPQTVLASTLDVTLSGVINKFGNLPGCTVQIRGLYTRRPN